MIPREILKKVRRVEIRTRGLVNEVFSGEYHSVFKGRGMNFAEVQEYQYGDDIRSIDWNVTARTGHPFVKVFEEERELTVMLLIDMSRSSFFGTVNQLLAGLAFLVITLWLWRRQKPVWFIVPPMLFMLAMPAWALLHELFRGGGLLDTKNWLLVFIAGVALVLEAWMLIEAALIWPRARGVLEEALPPLPSASAAGTASAGGRS